MHSADDGDTGMTHSTMCALLPTSPFSYFLHKYKNNLLGYPLSLLHCFLALQVSGTFKTILKVPRDRQALLENVSIYCLVAVIFFFFQQKPTVVAFVIAVLLSCPVIYASLYLMWHLSIVNGTDRLIKHFFYITFIWASAKRNVKKCIFEFTECILMSEHMLHRSLIETEGT